MASSKQCKNSQNHSEPLAGFLTSIKSLVRRPWQASSSSGRRTSPSRSRTSAGHNRSKSPELDWGLQSNPTVERRQTHPSPKSNGNNNHSRTLNQQCLPSQRRRGRHHEQKEVNSMADYLTLAQLENVWQQQDTCRADQAVATNDINSRAQRSLPRATQVAIPQPPLFPPPPLSSRDIHPALRPGPLFPEGLGANTNLKSGMNVHTPRRVKTFK